jgi:phospholipid/cholesterol/gamma-HCH transport system substrate-binding protein
VIKALRPASSSLLSVSASVQRLSDKALSGDNLDNLMEFIKGWSLATNGHDAISHYFNAMAVLTPSAVGDTLGGIVPGLPNVLKSVPVPTAPQLPLSGLSNLTGSLGKQKSSTSSSSSGATGLTQKQEQNLLSALLGGVL